MVKIMMLLTVMILCGAYGSAYSMEGVLVGFEAESTSVPVYDAVAGLVTVSVETPIELLRKLTPEMRTLAVVVVAPDGTRRKHMYNDGMHYNMGNNMALTVSTHLSFPIYWMKCNGDYMFPEAGSYRVSVSVTLYTDKGTDSMLSNWVEIDVYESPLVSAAIDNAVGDMRDITMPGMLPINWLAPHQEQLGDGTFSRAVAYNWMAYSYGMGMTPKQSELLAERRSTLAAHMSSDGTIARLIEEYVDKSDSGSMTSIEMECQGGTFVMWK